MIYETMVRLVQTDSNEIPHDTRHLGVPFCASKMIYDTMVYSMQTVHLSLIKFSTIPKRTKTSSQLSLVT
jgi:hypothetical protein